MKNKAVHYGLFTAVSMIIGIVVGSGIFFKSPIILKITGGSVALGVASFCIAASSIIFGSISLTELSVRTEKNGGVVGYFEDFVSPRLASGFGWFQTFVYLPTMGSVVAWVAGVYTCILFNIPSTLEIQILLALAYITLLFIINIFSLKLGGYFQNLSTSIKLIPLVIIAIVGFFGKFSHPNIPNNAIFVPNTDVGFGWVAALVPIAFSFDGWIVALSISNEVRNPRKNMPIALTFAPLICLAVYVMYFLGINSMLGSEYIMTMGDASVEKAAELILGSNGANAITIFVLIAILGVVNGLILGLLRMPQALASKNMLPNAKKIARINPKIGLSTGSCIISVITMVICLFIHYVTKKSNILGNSDISEIAIMFSYVSYVVLYLKIITLKRRKVIKNIFTGLISPIFASIGSLVFLIAGIVSNPMYMPISSIICTTVCAIGYWYYSKKVSAKPVIYS